MKNGKKETTQGRLGPSSKLCLRHYISYIYMLISFIVAAAAEASVVVVVVVCSSSNSNNNNKNNSNNTVSHSVS